MITTRTESLGRCRVALDDYELSIVMRSSPLLLAEPRRGIRVVCTLEYAGRHPATLEAKRRAIKHGYIHALQSKNAPSLWRRVMSLLATD